MLRLGYKASAEQFGPNELLEFSVLAEQQQFDSVFISDHFQPWRHTGGHSPFSIAWMGALGARTSRIVMGTSVLTPTFRYHPSVVAQAFATLGTMFRGRMILGVGTGESLNEVPATAMAWPEPKERMARLKEALALIRQLWSEERVSFRGQYYQTDRATIYDRTKPPPAIYVAGAGPLISKYAGQTADGFICTSGKAPELYRDTLLPGVAGGIASAGRKPQEVELMIEMKSRSTPTIAGRWKTRATGRRSRCRRRKKSQCRTRSRWSGLPTRCPWSGPPRAGSCRAMRTSMSRRFAPTWSSASGISFFMRRVPIRRGSSNCTRSTCCRNFGRHSRKSAAQYIA